MGWVNIKQNPQFMNLSKAEIQRKVIKDREGKIIGVAMSINSDRVANRVQTQSRQLQQAMDSSFFKIQQDMQRQANDVQYLFNNVFDYPAGQDRSIALRYAVGDSGQYYI